MAGTLTISTLSDGTYSTSSTNCIRGSAKAWAHWTVSGGVASVDNSFNISSVTRTATGEFDVNFTNALSTANSVFSGFARINANGGQMQCASNTVFTTTYVHVGTTNSGGTFTDPLQAGIVIFSS